MKRKAFIAKMSEVLRRRRESLRASLRQELSDLRSIEHGVVDSADLANESDSDEISSQLAAVESRELAMIENALLQIRKGKYGACESCGESIASARLQVLPYVTRCIRCQRTSEKRKANHNRIVDWSTVDDSVEESQYDEMAFNQVESEWTN